MAEQRAMGIGVIGQPDVDLKRENRFTFEIFGFCNNEKNKIPEHFVQIASRPTMTTEEITLDHLNARTYLPGKTTWETISVTYYDAAHAEMRSLYNWLATLYDFADPVRLRQGNKRNWDATGVLNMYDGCGTLIEGWELRHMFPTSVNFGGVDYASSEVAKIEMTLRFSDVMYRSYCPDFTPEGCCTPCGT